MSCFESPLTTEQVHELEQLYDLVVSDINANPAITWEEIICLYPLGKLMDALRHADLFGAEDSARHHFIEYNNKRYLKQEWDNMKLHQEIQDMFTEQIFNEVLPEDYPFGRIREEGVQW